MIRVNEDYIIEIDNFNYTAKRDTHRTTLVKDKATGNESEVPLYNTVGHYSNLTGAIKGIITDMNSRKLRDGMHSLEEAIAIVVENNNRVSELLERALEV
jgi:hypothetical protein